MDIDTQKQLNILIQLAEADKHFAQVERDMIMRIAQERNVSPEEVANLIRHPEPIESLATLSNDQKFEYLNSCIDLINSDHNIFESELIFAESIAIKLGFKKTVVDYLIENKSTTPISALKISVLNEFI